MYSAEQKNLILIRSIKFSRNGVYVNVSTTDYTTLLVVIPKEYDLLLEFKDARDRNILTAWLDDLVVAKAYVTTFDIWSKSFTQSCMQIS